MLRFLPLNQWFEVLYYCQLKLATICLINLWMLIQEKQKFSKNGKHHLNKRKNVCMCADWLCTARLRHLEPAGVEKKIKTMKVWTMLVYNYWKYCVRTEIGIYKTICYLNTLLEGCAKDRPWKRCEDLLPEDVQDLLRVRQLSEEVEEFQSIVLQEFSLFANIGVYVLVIFVSLWFRNKEDTFNLYFIFSSTCSCYFKFHKG
jgi:hypothetical protein